MIEEENQENEAQQPNPLEGFEFELLDAYFASRSPEPATAKLTGDAFTPEYKTTDDIYEELLPIHQVNMQVIVVYLRYHGYRLKTVADGTLRWEIWRDMRFIE